MSTHYKPAIIELTELYLDNYDPRLIAAQIEQESRWVIDARSPVGAMGLMQIMPATWKEETANEPQLDPDKPLDNLSVGIRYMSKRLKGWSAPRPEIDRICLALASYNAGFGNLLAAQKRAGGANDYASIIAALPDVTGHHAKETTQYVRKILSYYNRFVAQGW